MARTYQNHGESVFLYALKPGVDVDYIGVMIFNSPNKPSQVFSLTQVGQMRREVAAHPSCVRVTTNVLKIELMIESEKLSVHDLRVESVIEPDQTESKRSPVNDPIERTDQSDPVFIYLFIY